MCDITDVTNRPPHLFSLHSIVSFLLQLLSLREYHFGYFSTAYTSIFQFNCIACALLVAAASSSPSKPHSMLIWKRLCLRRQRWYMILCEREKSLVNKSSLRRQDFLSFKMSLSGWAGTILGHFKFQNLCNFSLQSSFFCNFFQTRKSVKSTFRKIIDVTSVQSQSRQTRITHFQPLKHESLLNNIRAITENTNCEVELYSSSHAIETPVVTLGNDRWLLSQAVV